MSEAKQWFPLESNPDVINSYVEKLGLQVKDCKFYDVMSTEEWALEMIPKPVWAVIMLFPIKDASEEYARQEKEKIDSNGQIVSNNVYYMKQTVGNACGTVGLLHAIGNARGSLSIEPNSYLARFYETTKSMTPDEIATYLNEDEEIEVTHEAAAAEGQTEAVMDVETHFICFTCVDGHLYELDGRKSFPINHGPCAPNQLLESACEVIKGFMERDPGEINYTIVTLAKNVDEE